jgi:hypothetical protein
MDFGLPRGGSSATRALDELDATVEVLDLVTQLGEEGAQSIGHPGVGVFKEEPDGGYDFLNVDGDDQSELAQQAPDGC